MSDILIYETEDHRIDVRLEQETVWLTQRQMAELFDTTPENVLMHLKNIFQDNELEESSTTKEFLVVRQAHPEIPWRLIVSTLGRGTTPIV